ncbi:hypothetical protein BJX61DRAFT_543404 [Aspergillus egyptiacus]|nr:hypothetical protein BJX61DRAFT_543404 [Aspergillus egyptiacus]
MILAAIFLLLAFVAPHVHASKLAGRYQLVYMWYAYRMDIQAFGIRDEMIAPNCFGSVPDGSCYFDEFVDYIQRDGKHLDPGQSTSVGKYFWPDAVDAANQVSQLTVGGNEFIPNSDPKKLFLEGTFTVVNPTNSDILELFTDRIQAARAKLGDAELADGLAESRTAMTGAHQARLHENVDGMIEVVNDYLADHGSSTKVEAKELPAVDGGTYKDLDLGKAYGADGGFSEHWQNFQTWLSQQKRTKKTTVGNVRMHWDAIQGVQKVASRVWGDSSC